MKSFIQRYQQTIRSHCIGAAEGQPDSMLYWKNKLFSSTIEFAIPLSLITVIPGVAYSLYLDLVLLATLDVAAFILVLFIAFYPKGSAGLRKTLFILCIYLVGLYLFYFIGFKGPGFLFLYAGCIYGIIIMPVRYAYLWSWINVGIAVLFVLVLHFDLSPLPDVNQTSVAEWVAISVNLIFLSFATSAFMPILFEGMERSMERQRLLQADLRAKQHELEEAMHDLKLKNSDLEQFAYVASHDLQEPLRMITSFMTQLENKYGHLLDDRGKQYIHIAQDGGKRMRQIILDLLEYSRVGRLGTTTESVDLNELVAQVVQTQQQVIRECSGQVKVGQLPTLENYRTPLIQIFQNLIDNALKYRRPQTPPVIQVTAHDLSQEWEFRVQDNGIGINPQYFERIFVIFNRLHGRDEYSGTGIGLTIVKKIIENLGGKIWLDSTEGEGSTFYFTLPKRMNIA